MPCPFLRTIARVTASLPSTNDLCRTNFHMATPLSVPSKTPAGPQPNTPTTGARRRRLSQSQSQSLKQPKSFSTCSLCIATRSLHSGGSLLHLHGHRAEPCKGSNRPPLEQTARSGGDVLPLEQSQQTPV